MKVSERTIKALGIIATGDEILKTKEKVAPYQSGPKLVAFFNDFGANAVYGQGFPSRWSFAEEEIRKHNGNVSLGAVIEALLDPERFFETEFTVEGAVAHANKYLERDGFTLTKHGNRFRVVSTKGVSVTLESPQPAADPLTHEFINDQITKCDRKLAEADYSGAITNARSMLEAVLLALEQKLSTEPIPEFDGDLPKVYKRVQKLLNLDPARKDISDALKCVLSGLSNIVHGLAPISNKMGDRHAATFRPAKHHAKLTVNAAKTLVDFLHGTFEYQSKRTTQAAPPTVNA